MLTPYRRHLKGCPHRGEGRKYRRCQCPIWVDGTLTGREIRQSLGLRDWEKAQERVRQWEVEGSAAPEHKTEVDLVTIDAVCERFLRSKQAQGLREASLYKYRLLCRELREFARMHGLQLIQEVGVNWLDEFRASWRNKNISAKKKLERLRALFHFAVQRGHVPDNPASKLKSPIVKDPPTLPFEPEEMTRILAACDD